MNLKRKAETETGVLTKKQKLYPLGCPRQKDLKVGGQKNNFDTPNKNSDVQENNELLSENSDNGETLGNNETTKSVSQEFNEYAKSDSNKNENMENVSEANTIEIDCDRSEDTEKIEFGIKEISESLHSPKENDARPVELEKVASQYSMQSKLNGLKMLEVYNDMESDTDDENTDSKANKEIKDEPTNQEDNKNEKNCDHENENAKIKLEQNENMSEDVIEVIKEDTNLIANYPVKLENLFPIDESVEINKKTMDVFYFKGSKSKDSLLANLQIDDVSVSSSSLDLDKNVGSSTLSFAERHVNAFNNLSSSSSLEIESSYHEDTSSSNTQVDSLILSDRINMSVEDLKSETYLGSKNESISVTNCLVDFVSNSDSSTDNFKTFAPGSSKQSADEVIVLLEIETTETESSSDNFEALASGSSKRSEDEVIALPQFETTEMESSTDNFEALASGSSKRSEDEVIVLPEIETTEMDLSMKSVKVPLHKSIFSSIVNKIKGKKSLTKRIEKTEEIKEMDLSPDDTMKDKSSESKKKTRKRERKKPLRSSKNPQLSDEEDFSDGEISIILSNPLICNCTDTTILKANQINQMAKQLFREQCFEIDDFQMRNSDTFHKLLILNEIDSIWSRMALCQKFQYYWLVINHCHLRENIIDNFVDFYVNSPKNKNQPLNRDHIFKMWKEMKFSERLPFIFEAFLFYVSKSTDLVNEARDQKKCFFRKNRYSYYNRLKFKPYL